MAQPLVKSFVKIRAPQAYRVATRLERDAVAVNLAVRAKTRQWGYELAGKIRENILDLGMIRTGKYINSIKVDWRGSNAFQAQIRVGSDEPQSRRLEFGFSGADALGRVYNQPPRPHFRPALREMDLKMQVEVPAVIEGVLAGD